jgi:hypothetical protein
MPVTWLIGVIQYRICQANKRENWVYALVTFLTPFERGIEKLMG